MTLALVVTGVALSVLFKNHADQQFERELASHFTQLVANLEINSEQKLSLRTQPADPRFNKPLSGLYWQVVQHGGEVTLRSRSLWDSTLNFPREENTEREQPIFYTLTGPNAEALKAIEQSVSFSEAPAKTWRLIVASETNSLTLAIQDWDRLLMGFLGVLFVTLMVAVVSQVALGLSPLRKLQMALHTLRTGKSKRLEGNFPIEIQPLIKELNQVLNQNEVMIQQAQNRAGDFAHAMKTPLTVLANAATQALQHDGSHPELAKLVNEQIGLLKDQVGQQLLRARADAISVRLDKKTTVGPVIDTLVRVMKKIHADKNIIFTVPPIDPNLLFPGDANELQEMLGNLLDNACKWTHAVVRVRAFTSSETLHILVEDDGAGVPDHQLDQITQRGVRADQRTPGSGLGLSIVTELVTVYRGRLQLSRSELGGLGAELVIPTDTEDLSSN